MCSVVSGLRCGRQGVLLRLIGGHARTVYLVFIWTNPVLELVPAGFAAVPTRRGLFGDRPLRSVAVGYFARIRASCYVLFRDIRPS